MSYKVTVILLIYTGLLDQYRWINISDFFVSFFQTEYPKRLSCLCHAAFKLVYALRQLCWSCTWALVVHVRNQHSLAHEQWVSISRATVCYDDNNSASPPTLTPNPLICPISVFVVVQRQRCHETSPLLVSGAKMAAGVTFIFNSQKCWKTTVKTQRFGWD